MNALVTTTINPPTEALIKFSEMKDWYLIVVGDIKTPEKKYVSLRCDYLSPYTQSQMYPELSEVIKWNKIQRRNIGMLYAYKQMAKLIATVDDDNIPYDFWGRDIYVDQPTRALKVVPKCDVFDPVGIVGSKIHHLWHRGFPIDLVSNRGMKYREVEANITPDIQAGLWNGDPDVDAVCRMIYNPQDVKFEDIQPYFSDSPSPFNSQNTILSRRVIPDYFLFPFIGRMDDIWAAYYAEAKGWKVLYTKPTVYQVRNKHNLLSDMEQEWIGYMHNSNLIEALRQHPDNIQHFLPEESWRAFQIWKGYFNGAV